MRSSKPCAQKVCVPMSCANRPSTFYAAHTLRLRIFALKQRMPLQFRRSESLFGLEHGRAKSKCAHAQEGSHRVQSGAVLLRLLLNRLRGIRCGAASTRGQKETTVKQSQKRKLISEGRANSSCWIFLLPGTPCADKLIRRFLLDCTHRIKRKHKQHNLVSRGGTREGNLGWRKKEGLKVWQTQTSSSFWKPKKRRETKDKHLPKLDA